MPKRSYTQKSVGDALGWAGLLVGVASAVPLMLQGPQSIYFWIPLVGGIAVLAFSFATHTNHRFFGWLISLLGGRVVGIATCTDEQVNAVHAIAHSFFGDAVSEPHKINEIRSKYKQGLQVALGRDREGVVRVLGYYFLFPINKRCCDRIHKFDFALSNLTKEDIATKPAYGHAIYIGAIAARGLIAQSELIGAVKANTHMVAQTKGKIAYARAATKRGLELLKENGFTPVHPEATGVNCFYKKSFAQEASLAAAELG
jgi:hypothetical protein